MSTIDEALRTAIREAVAEGLREPLAQLRTALEAGKLLRIGRHTVYKLVNAGYLKCTRFGKKLIFSREELDRFMSLHGHHAPEDMTPSVRRRLSAS